MSLAAAGSVAEAAAAGYQRCADRRSSWPPRRRGPPAEALCEREPANLTRSRSPRPRANATPWRPAIAFEAGQGWIWIDPRPGAVALKLFRERGSGRTRLTAGPQDEQDAAAKGYGFVRIEGYATPAAP